MALVVVVMLDEASSRAAQKAIDVCVCVAIDLVNIFFPIPIGKQRKAVPIPMEWVTVHICHVAPG